MGDVTASAMVERLPTLFFPHGGPNGKGPWPFMEVGLGNEAERAILIEYLRSVGAITRQRPKAVLVVSAHWEEEVPTVTACSSPALIYDPYGPPEHRAIHWPTIGHPELANRVRELLVAAGIEAAVNPERGLDHGTFVPLHYAYPEANVPTIELSLKAGLNAAEHLAIGRALRPLRDEGVLLLGSGMTYHNILAFGKRSNPASLEFDVWLGGVLACATAERDRCLAEWETAPFARKAHPREEHLIPLMVVAGAAGEDRGRSVWEGTIGGARVSAYQFG